MTARPERSWTWMLWVVFGGLYGYALHLLLRPGPPRPPPAPRPPVRFVHEHHHVHHIVDAGVCDQVDDERDVEAS